MKDINIELRYCKKCVQMTNHRVIKIQLQIIYACLKCEVELRNEKTN